MRRGHESARIVVTSALAASIVAALLLSPARADLVFAAESNGRVGEFTTSGAMVNPR